MTYNKAEKESAERWNKHWQPHYDRLIAKGTIDLAKVEPGFIQYFQGLTPNSNNELIFVRDDGDGWVFFIEIIAGPKVRRIPFAEMFKRIQDRIISDQRWLELFSLVGD